MKISVRQRFIIGLLFFACTLILWFSGMTKFMTFEQINLHLTWLRELVAYHYVLTVVAFFAIFFITTVGAIPSASMLILISGLLFGMVPGFIYSVCAATIGAIASFLITRYLFAGFVQEKYGKQLHLFNTAIKQQGYRYLILIRLIPVLPFFVTNMVASCLPISWQTFAITTFIGVMPITGLYSYAASQISQLTSFSDIFTIRMIVVFVIVVILGTIPLILTRFKKKE